MASCRPASCGPAREIGRTSFRERVEIYEGAKCLEFRRVLSRSRQWQAADQPIAVRPGSTRPGRWQAADQPVAVRPGRSEERRLGKEWRSTRALSAWSSDVCSPDLDNGKLLPSQLRSGQGQPGLDDGKLQTSQLRSGQ